MLARVHPVAATVGLLTILIFWTCTVLVELFGSEAAVRAVKLAIPWGLPVLVLALAVTGATGFRLAGGWDDPVVLAKKRRMPVIAANGLLVLIPSAVTLAVLASAHRFGVAFYLVQALELVAGAVNIGLMTLNARDGRRLRRRG
ncbi:hypothetical protein FEK33_29125 [Nocardia asteroides NBRC 15531]|uniref:Transmembrane protein n=1 Tax=Nocardia asteroides NBRC 15531 TaxID=1110697 RepID=U5E9X4_NOCAS|nr:hypothetical protein [Nocardia asteroides]TLF62517.1 hypothetical protein FEK33_29125 [Nocardia asteroides NBRC 15531]UGT46729.1 hypothetical protein LT345_19540 [Nocardia asteroides]SFN63148.1 hypothetical protein SAMN05444423_11187 [Nocardia asteroides]VEG34421.1 Uncharacterised protein [Nocardia asteroides]GAD83273.1 hypothetical protein NCAST_18_01260 [Nocardia asteroides NBRC 15531]